MLADKMWLEGFEKDSSEAGVRDFVMDVVEGHRCVESL